MTPFLEIKLGAAAALLALLSWWLFRAGEDHANTAAEAAHVKQMAAVVATYDARLRELQGIQAEQQKVVDKYDAIKDLPDPASIGTAHRLYIVAASGCAVPATAQMASGTPESTRSTVGPSEVERALNDYIQACGRDDKRLTAVQELAPK